MDGHRFDELARHLATNRTRRGFLRLLGGSLAAGVVALQGHGPAGAIRCLSGGQPCRPDLDCCSGKCCDGVCCLDLQIVPPLGPPVAPPVQVIGPPALPCLAPGADCDSEHTCCSGTCCDGRCCPNNEAVCCGDICCPTGSACAFEGEVVPGGGFRVRAVCCPSGVTCQDVCCPNPDDVCCAFGTGCCPAA